MDRSLLGQKRFGPLFFTQFLGALNDNFFKNALVILITYQSVVMFGLESGALVAAAGGVFILPFFLFSATAGQLADRYDKALLVRLTKVTELVFMALAALGFFLGSYEMLMVVLFLMGVQSAFFGPLKYGLLPEVLKPHELVKGNSHVATGTFVAILLGTIMGGQSAAAPSALLAISLGVVGLALVGLILAYQTPYTGIQNPALKVNWNFFTSTVEIMKMSRQDRSLFRTLMGISWFWFLGAGVLSVLPVFVKEIMGGDESVATFFLALFTIGMGVGAFICQFISSRRAEVGVTPIAGFLMSLTLLDLWLVGRGQPTLTSELVALETFWQLPGALRAMFDLLLIAIFGGLFIIPQMTSLQEEAPQGELARYIAANNIWNSLFMVVASVLIMLFYGLGLNAAHVMALLGGMNLLFSFLLYSWRSEVTLRFIASVLAHTFYRIKVKGSENFPAKNSFIIVSNHVSFIDWLFLMAISPRPVRFVIDHAYYYRPGLMFWLKQAHLIPIATKRESEERLNEAFARIYEALEEGAVVGIFPEGHITHDGELRRFQPGVRKVVRARPAPVVPIVLKGLWGSTFSRQGAGVFKKWNGLRRRVVVIEILPALGPDEYDSQSAHALIEANLKGAR